MNIFHSFDRNNCGKVYLEDFVIGIIEHFYLFRSNVKSFINLFNFSEFDEELNYEKKIVVNRLNDGMNSKFKVIGPYLMEYLEKLDDVLSLEKLTE